MLKEVFNSDVAGASLHIDNLKGQDGEIGLRIGNADYFGVERWKLVLIEEEFKKKMFENI